MIFVTIGSMFPFDRMIRVMDDWAARNASQETFAQIGTGSYEPTHIVALRDDEALTGMARGVGFRLVEALGVVPRAEISSDVRDLDQDQLG